jgi:hypothetical protein
MNKYQEICCRTYGGGDYADILEKPELWEVQARNAGDTLFLFLMLELEDCGDDETVLNRLHTAMRDVDTVLGAMPGGAS